jgi:hypothetical protein
MSSWHPPDFRRFDYSLSGLNANGQAFCRELGFFPARRSPYTFIATQERQHAINIFNGGVWPHHRRLGGA